MERLLSLPYSSIEEAFVLQYRCQLEAQSKKQTVAPLQQDPRGVAFSTADGTHARAPRPSFRGKSVSDAVLCCQAAGRRPRPL